MRRHALLTGALAVLVLAGVGFAVASVVGGEDDDGAVTVRTAPPDEPLAPAGASTTQARERTQTPTTTTGTPAPAPATGTTTAPATPPASSTAPSVTSPEGQELLRESPDCQDVPPPPPDYTGPVQC